MESLLVLTFTFIIQLYARINIFKYMVINVPEIQQKGRGYGVNELFC